MNNAYEGMSAEELSVVFGRMVGRRMPVDYGFILFVVRKEEGTQTASAFSDLEEEQVLSLVEQMIQAKEEEALERKEHIHE